MSKKANQILDLVNKQSAAANDITSPLKVIGDGNMLDGVKNIAKFFQEYGKNQGRIQGGAAVVGIVGVGIAAYKFIPKGIGFIKANISKKKAHDEMGEKIVSALDEELKTSKQLELEPTKSANTDIVIEAE